jgi:3-methyladenine DNA glycosylase AlkC
MIEIPGRSKAIEKGKPLKNILDRVSVEQLAINISTVMPSFCKSKFVDSCLENLDSLELMQRADHIAVSLRKNLALRYSESIAILIASMTPPKLTADSFGLSEFFYLPHSSYISLYGNDKTTRHDDDNFDISMAAIYELTQRFTSEFAIRSFLHSDPDRVFTQLEQWVNDKNPHVRRLCSEGIRPRLPWGKRVPFLTDNPERIIGILKCLRNDSSEYVRRSVANNLGDIAKTHLDLVLSVCEEWFDLQPSKDMASTVRHAIRYPLKNLDERARFLEEKMRLTKIST